MKNTTPTPIDPFDEIEPIDPSSTPSAPAPKTDTPVGIDFNATQQQLRVAIDYIQDSRRDFPSDSKTQQWIDTVENTLEKALQEVRDLEIKHIDEMVEWKDEEGGTHEILVRRQDEKGFDRMQTLYEETERQFQDYFIKHVETVRQQAQQEQTTP